MPEQSTYDFLDATDAPVGPELNLGATRRSLGVPAPSARPQRGDFVSRNFAGMPIDLDRELSSDVKTKLLLREKPEDQIAFLEELVGKGNVRLADDKTPLLTVYDAKRKMPVEFRALGGGANIIPHLQSTIPEMAMSAAAMALARKLPTPQSRLGRFSKWAAEMGAGAVGEKVGAAAKDIAVSSTPLDEIIAQRASEVPGTAAFYGGIGGAATLGLKAGGRALSPFGGPMGEIEKGTAEAVEHFASKYGVNYPLTTGERISSPLFKRVEATMSRQPGASSSFDKIQRQKVEALRQIQAKMLSSRLDPSDVGMLRKLEEDVGEEAITAIRQNLHPLQRAEETARSVTAQSANEAIMSELSKAVGPARQLYPEQVGAKLRSGAFSKRAAFDAEAERLYNDAYGLPGGTDKALTPPSLAADARRLLREQPSIEKTVTRPSGLVGPSGQPLVSTATETEVLQQFVPEGIRPMLESLSGTAGGRFSLRDLVKMRTEVRNNIKRGEAVPGVDTHYLGEIEGSLTKAIDESTAALPTAELRTAWGKANDFYRDNVQPFKEKNIARLFRDKETGAFVQDEDLIRNIGPSEYKSYKNFFGANSAEFKDLKRALIDNLLPGEDLIDAKDFLAKLYQFSGKNRSVAEDILGPQTTQRLERISGLLKNVQDGDVVDRDSIVNLLVGAQQNKLLSNLDELVGAQRKLNAVYKSQIIKDIGSGKLGERFDSTEFVNRLWETASPNEIAAIKAQLPPETLEDLRRKVAERVFKQSQDPSRSISEQARLAAGEPYARGSVSALESVFGSEQNKARLTALLGKESMDDFEQLAKILRGGKAAESAFAGAGGFSAQMQIHRMFRGGVFSYLADWAKQKIAAILYFSPLRNVITQQTTRSPELQANLARSIVLSHPFLDAMQEDFGDTSGIFVDKALDSIDLYQQQGGPGQKAVRQQEWIDRFLEEAERTNPSRQRVFPVR